MRFKKLHFFVGLALILFVIIVGNIIIFGKLLNTSVEMKVNNSDQNLTLPDPKNLFIENVSIVPTPSPIVLPVVDKPVPPPVVQKKIKTRAS